MTKEEKEELRLQKAHAGQRCRETYATICQLKKILADYYKDYYRWGKRFDDADRKLALEEKLTKVPSPGKEVKAPKEINVKLTKEQILALIDELGTLNFDD